jgi:hypothetical protein
MIDPEMERIQRVVDAYGLRAYPYEIERELDPLREAQDEHLASWVDGWRDARKLGAFLSKRAQNRTPILVVIGGGSGTGRTSLANFLVHMWAKAHKTDLEKLALVPWTVKSFDGDEQMWKWALSIRQLLVSIGVDVSDVANDAFNELIKSKPEATGAALQRLLNTVVGDLRSEERALASIIEGVNHPSFLTVAGESLPYVDMLLVMTVDDTPANRENVLNGAEAAVDGDVARILRLTELSGADAKDVVQTRWNHCFGGPGESPFSDQGLIAAFDEPRRTLRRVLRLAGALLANKELELGESDRWHEEKLFTDEELKKKIPYLDAELR